MYTYNLALLVLGATVAYAYPASNSESIALAARSHVLAPMSTAYPGVTNTAERDPHMPRSIDDRRRQIHNADYHANGPPPSPNPAPAQESPIPSPVNAPASAPSRPAAKDKRFVENVKVQERRQIRNADYHANGPPPSPNPAPAQESPIPPPANAPAPAPSAAPKAKRIVEPFNVERRQIRNADYHANGPPPSPNPATTQESPAPSPAAAPSQPAAKDKRFFGPGPVFHPGSSSPHPEYAPRSIDDLDATLKAEQRRQIQKRQIRNADYHSNAPPPSPNPAPAQESPAPSSANPAAVAPSQPTAKDKRFATSIGSDAGSPSSCGKEDLDVGKRTVAMMRSNKRSVDIFGPNGAFGARAASDSALRIMPLITGGWYGWHRRVVEELMNVNNHDIDHDAITRWSKAEVEKMQAWSRQRENSAMES
ncbi:hypothetical protein C8R43DRAFT_1020895 [Mycena crocata]|nr:hypothetical protein C8R43DRAFT_1020895 [Mycena crocata]